MSCRNTTVGSRVSSAPEQKTCAATVPMSSLFSEGSRKEGHLWGRAKWGSVLRAIFITVGILVELWFLLAVLHEV